MGVFWLKIYPQKWGMTMDFFGRLRTNGKEKNPLFLTGFALLWTTLDRHLVEAGGIEPPSGNIPLQVLRTYPLVCFRRQPLPKAGWVVTIL